MGLVAEARFLEGADRLLVLIVERHGSTVLSEREITGYIYAALLANEAIAGPNPITVQSMYPVEG